MRSVLRRIHWILSVQFGLDPVRLARGLWNLPGFARDFWRFRRASNDPKLRMEVVPALHDRSAGAGIADEYFWQDLTVARMVFLASPRLHVDVGSLLTGFVAHVASFREIELIDIRPLEWAIPNVRFRQADMMGKIGDIKGYADSLSCLHAIEHFGLGRYGDPLDPKGLEKGIANLAAILQSGGTLYLSTPIGRERVEFNANWVFDPKRIVTIGAKNQLELTRLLTVQGGEVTEISDPHGKLRELADQRYTLGIFVFSKVSATK